MAVEKQEYQRIVGDHLEIRVKLNGGTPSASGKTLVIASSHGNQPIEGSTYKGKEVILGFNAYIKP